MASVEDVVDAWVANVGTKTYSPRVALKVDRSSHMVHGRNCSDALEEAYGHLDFVPHPCPSPQAAELLYPFQKPVPGPGRGHKSKRSRAASDDEQDQSKAQTKNAVRVARPPQLRHRASISSK
eukprot:1360229-Prymnesium_polylepis.1